MKDLWSKYATKERLKQKGYIREYSNRSPKRKTTKPSCSHCILKSREGQKEEVELRIQAYGKVVLLTEQVVPNEPFTESEQLALDIYANALKGLNGTGIRRDVSEGKSGEVVMAVQDIPKKRTRHNRKTTSA